MAILFLSGHVSRCSFWREIEIINSHGPSNYIIVITHCHILLLVPVGAVEITMEIEIARWILALCNVKDQLALSESMGWIKGAADHLFFWLLSLIRIHGLLVANSLMTTGEHLNRQRRFV